MNPRAAHPKDLPSREDALRFLGPAVPSLPLRTVPVPPVGLLAALPPPPPGRSGWPWTVQSPPPARSAGPFPRISIVTPAFRHGAYLEECLRSVLLQNYPNLEYIVMDGGSEDGTRELLEKYRPWLSHARSGPDKGQGHALNLGFALAGGELLGWLNSDDFYLPGALLALAEASSAQPRHAFFYGDGLDLREGSPAFSYALAPFAHGRYRHFGGLILSHAAFWRSSIHEPVWERMRCNVDGELWQRLLPGRRCLYLPLPLGVSRIQAEAKTVHTRHRQAWVEDDAEIWALHGKPPPARSWLRLEYKLVQRLSRFWRARSGQARRRRVLEACSWPNLPSPPHA